MPELDGKKRIIDYETVIDPDENYYVPVDNGTEGTGKVSVKMVGPSDMISDAYSDQDTYAVGDVCIHNNILYVCNTEIDTPHAFDLSEWDPDTLGNYCSKLNSDVNEINSALSQKVKKGWTLFSTTVPTSGNPTPLPNDFDELLISVSFNAPNGWHSSEFYIPKELLSGTSVKHAAGWYYSASDCASFMVQLDNTNITQVSTTRGGAGITAYMQAYYR